MKLAGADVTGTAALRWPRGYCPTGIGGRGASSAGTGLSLRSISGSFLIAETRSVPLCYAGKRGEIGGVIEPRIHLSQAAILSRQTGPPLFVHNVWSLDFKYARYAKKLADCAGTYGSAAPGWVSSGSVNSEPKPVRLGPGADHRLPPIVVYNNINLK
jgi:hypothetical protein